MPFGYSNIEGNGNSFNADAADESGNGKDTATPKCFVNGNCNSTSVCVTFQSTI
jgi:hypothetical protein